MAEITRKRALQVYKKLEGIIDYLQNIQEEFSGDDAFGHIYTAIDDFEDLMKELAERFDFSVDEKIYTEQELKDKKECENATANKENAMKFVEKNRISGFGIEFANELCKVLGIETPQTIDYKGHKLVPALSIVYAMKKKGET